MALNGKVPPSSRSPWLPRYLLIRLARPADREFLMGDLEELWAEQVARSGQKRASCWYWSQVLRSLYFITCSRLRCRKQVESSEERSMLESCWKDFKFATRLAYKRPGFSLVVVLTLALGIGANTAVYSLLNAFIYRQLPVPAGERLVSIFNQNPDGSYKQNLSYPQIEDLDQQGRTFDGALGFSLVRASMNHGDITEMVYGEAVTGNYFELLQVKPFLGRTFVAEELRSRKIVPIVVISHGLWLRRFGGDPSVVGDTISLNGAAYLVVGVAADGFAGSKFALSMNFWVPVQTMPEFQRWTSWGERDSYWLNCFARVREDKSLEEVQAELRVISSRLDQDYPETQRGRIARAQWARGVFSELDPSMGPTADLASVLALGIALSVLLIACANVANLVLARGQTRVSEMGLRLAIGASRRQLFRQLLFESLVLSLTGGALGVLLAFVGVSGLPLLFPAIPYELNFPASPDLEVLGGTLALTLLTGILFGLVPMFSLRRDSGLSLQANLTSGRSLRSGWGSRRFLVVFQLAVSSLLMVISGLFVRSLENAQHIDPGFLSSNLLMSRIDLQLASFTPETGSVLIAELEEKLASLPGVEAAGLTNNLPLDDSDDSTLVWARGVHLRSSEGIDSEFIVTTPNLFQALGIQLLSGRFFTSQDRPETGAVTLVSKSLAERLWPGESPLKRMISVEGPEGPFWEVIGVVNDVKYRTLSEQSSPAIYMSMYQNYRSSPSVVLKTTAEPSELITSLRQTIRNLHPDIPVFRTITFQDHIGNAVWPSRMGAALASVFGAIALLLAAIGLYGLMSFAVTQRIREMGIRTALGANPADLLRLVMVSGSGTVLLGLATGLTVSFWAVKPLASLLYGFSGFDLWTFLAASVVLLGVALLACYMPARRAAGVDPMRALRYE